MAATEVRIVAAVDDGLETVRESSRPESSQSDDDEGGEQGTEAGIERGLVRWKQGRCVYCMPLHTRAHLHLSMREA
jgi:hypothetical protein